MRRLVCVLAVALGAGALSPAAAPALTIGIADQKHDMFRQKAFKKLGVRHARLAVSWDAMNNPWEVTQIDHWLYRARWAGVARPLVVFGHSRVDRRKLPTSEQFLYEFRRFRKRYPWVRTFATWNEANHCGQPTCNKPALVASYYRRLRKECRRCTILGATVLDMPNMTRWVKRFRRAAREEPVAWGLHNYIDANRFRTSGTRALLRVTRGKIWFTETGGIVRRRTKVRVPLAESREHAARATAWVFDELAPLSRRITRVYVYHWNRPKGPVSWDSALIGPTGKPRPALKVLRRELERVQAAARRAARRSAARRR